MKMSLKMCALAALFVVGMSSCLKKNDSLNAFVQYAYVLQNEYGTFTPQIRLIGDELVSASAQIAGKNFAFTKVNDLTWELDDNNPFFQLDNITAGYYMLTVTGLNGKTETSEFGLSEASKRISPVNLTTLEYSEKTMKVELADSVLNADAYFLMIKIPTDQTYTSFSMWVPYGRLDLTGDKKLSATVSISNLGNERYRFAVGATYGSVVRISEKTITVENEEQVE